MQRYFTSCSDNNISISEDDIFHILKVMRMKKADRFEINNDGDIFVAEITSTSPFLFKIVDKLEQNHELGKKITLLYCLPKGDKIDAVLQKATELGVYKIVLVNSSRTIAKIIPENKEKKFFRFNKIIKEAAEQCKRNIKPICDEIIDFKNICDYKSDLNFIAYENADQKLMDLHNKLKSSDYQSVSVLIGAEGGFSKEEVDLAVKYGFDIISLGSRILRSETSVFYLLSVLGYEIERL